MNVFIKCGLVVGLLLVGGGLLLVKTDREYINLTPTEGTAAGIVLESDHSYEQTFIARRPTITRLGIFLRPAQTNTPSGEVELTLRAKEQILGQATLSTAFIDAQGTTQVRFSPPLTVAEQQAVTIAIRMPLELSGSLRLQQRQRDDTFDATNVTFQIDGIPQDNPAAYQVFYQHRPYLARQLAGLSFLGAALLLVPSLPLYIFGMATVFTVPAGGLTSFNWTLFAYAAVALAGMIMLLHKDKSTLLPALLGANIFAFSTWFPLQLQGGRPWYALAAVLPLLLALGLRRNELPSRRQKHLWIAVVLFGLLILYLVSALPAREASPQHVANPRDVFLDPNQTVSAEKVPESSWDHFGSYIGIINLGLAAIGISLYGRRHKEILTLGALCALAAFTPLYRIPGLPFPPQHLVIGVTFAVAYFAAWGLSAAQNFLHRPHSGRDLIITIIVGLIVLISLLDMWQVGAASLEYAQLL